MELIDKAAIVAEIERRIKEYNTPVDRLGSNNIRLHECEDILSFINTLEVKDADLTDRKTDWSPSRKQMESLKDMLKYNIGVFDYQKFMEVYSLYEDLTKILDYETDRQK